MELMGGGKLASLHQSHILPRCSQPPYTSLVGVEVLRLYEAAMQLPATDRAELVAMLLDSADDGSTQGEIDAAWVGEVRRRTDEIATGRAETIPLDDVLREGRELIENAERARLG
jgi:putative addiction module component (TIGR02574 family)